VWRKAEGAIGRGCALLLWVVKGAAALAAAMAVGAIQRFGEFERRTEMA